MLHFIYFFSTNVSNEYFKHAAHSLFFSSICHLFHNATFFGSCIIHILHTRVLKFKCKNSGAKRLNNPSMMVEMKCQLLFRTVELQIQSSLKCSLVQCAQKPVTRKEWKFNQVHRFNTYGSVHSNNILLYKSQQDAHVTQFILSDNCSTYFRHYYHPSSGAQNNCNYSIW